MKIILDTAKRMIREKPQRSDRKKPKNQVEADVANIMGIAIAGQAMKLFKTEKARTSYLAGVMKMAVSTLEANREDKE